MDALLVGIALMIPVVTGGLCLHALLPHSLPGRSSIVLGGGTLIGLVFTAQILHLSDTIGLPLSFSSVLITTAMAALAAALLSTRYYAAGLPVPQEQPVSTVQRLLIRFLLVLIAARLFSLGLEVWHRPLFPWDATMHWATKARAWFEHRQMVPFVYGIEWLKLGGDGVYTDRHPHYPATIPLLQVYMSLALDRWDESLINLPWLAALIALGAMFYGLLRVAGVTLTLAVVATYMLLSLPLINTHVALAGYADIFLGATYGGALMCLHNWLNRREPWLLILTVLFAACCPLLKTEGFIWAATLIPGAIFALYPLRHAAKLSLMLLLWGILLALLIPEALSLVGFSWLDMYPAFNPVALKGVILSLLLHSSWHLLGYVLLAILGALLLLRSSTTRQFRGLGAALACASLSYLYLFIFTGFGEGAENFAAVGRLSIHLAPGLLFFCTLTYNALLQDQAQANESKTRHATS